MAYTVKCKNNIITGRICLEMALYPITEINLMLGRDQLDESDYVMDMIEARSYFDNCIRDYWDGAILVEDGVPVDPSMGKLIYVDFNPSLENISKAVYDCLAPKFFQDGVQLLKAVEVVVDDGTATYTPEDGSTKVRWSAGNC